MLHKSYKLITALVSCAFLSACITTYSDAQLAAMNNDQLCSAVQSDPTNYRNVTYMTGRKLHCHPAQITCQRSGLDAHSKEYAQCVQAMLVQITNEHQQQEAVARAFGDALGQGMQNYGHAIAATPAPAYQPVTTHCSGSGNTATCTSF